ncbi:MAG: hypothetical protein M0O96_02590 [Desulforhopalus sp.]|nr:hypothetical protein [Desulforhopalus sp.]
MSNLEWAIESSEGFPLALSPNLTTISIKHNEVPYLFVNTGICTFNGCLISVDFRVDE